MDADNVKAASDEIQVFGDRPEPQWAQACADDGSEYRWVRSLNRVFRYTPGDVPPVLRELAEKLQSVVDAGMALGWRCYAGPCVGEREDRRWGNPGFDCSSFVASMYGRVLGIELAGFTDAIADQTDEISEADALPGDIILYRYDDSCQPAVKYPHTGLWLRPGWMLDCQYPRGLGEHPILAHAYEIHRARGL